MEASLPMCLLIRAEIVEGPENIFINLVLKYKLLTQEGWKKESDYQWDKLGGTKDNRLKRV